MNDRHDSISTVDPDFESGVVIDRFIACDAGIVMITSASK